MKEEYQDKAGGNVPHIQSGYLENYVARAWKIRKGRSFYMPRHNTKFYT